MAEMHSSTSVVPPTPTCTLQAAAAETVVRLLQAVRSASEMVCSCYFPRACTRKGLHILLGVENS